jgi:hypothetical protein
MLQVTGAVRVPFLIVCGRLLNALRLKSKPGNRKYRFLHLRFDYMKIVLLGATGGVGGHFLNKALAAGHQVNALVRTPSKLAERPNLTITKGDVANPDEVGVVFPRKSGPPL